MTASCRAAAWLLDDDTVFEWGSATRLLVWVSVMQLWEEGRLDLNADVREYLPEGFMTNLNSDTPVTMLNLMNHNAGFQEMVFEPGTVTAYSNWGVALAGYIVERISGEPFYAYVHEHIFDVLGMEHTALAPDLSDDPWVRERRRLLQCYTTRS